jgi:sulfite reductase (ferredoxin)
MLLGLSTSAYQLAGGPTAGRPARAAASQVRMDVADVPGLVQGQKYGPTAPAHPAVKPWTNLETQEGVQLVKAKSEGLRQPLLDDMANDEIFVSKDSIHILKHHGSYMQQNRELKKKVRTLTLILART